MKILRTANAGVLLELDGVKLLLDGVCPPYPPFLGCPPEIRARLLREPPDALAFTHRHPDHYDGAFAEKFERKTLRPVFGAEDLSVHRVGSLKITPVAARHIGKVEIPHVGFIIEGSSCIWFTGDASPLVWKKLDLPKPDLLIAPYAYAATPAAWKQTMALGAEKILLLHLPLREEDPLGLWAAVEETTAGDPRLIIPVLGKEITI